MGPQRTGETDELDQYEQALNHGWDLVIEFTATPEASARDAVFDSLSGPREPSGELKQLFSLQTRILAAQALKDSLRARLTADDSLDRKSRERLGALVQRDSELDAAFECCLAQSAIYTGLASTFALRTDASGGKANTLLNSLFRLRPRRERAGDPLVEDRRNGLDKVSGEMLNHFKTFGGKPLAYHATAIRKEAKRDALEQLKRDRDRLGLTDAPPELRTELNATATDAVALAVEEQRANEVMISSEIASEQRQVIEALRAELPEDQRALFDLVQSGLSWTEARRVTGAKQSIENALRNHIRRFAERRSRNRRVS